MIVQHRLFHFCILQKNCVLLCSYFEGERGEGTPDASPRFGIGKPMLKNYQILPYTQEIRGKNRSRQCSSRNQNFCTTIYLRRPRYLVGRGSIAALSLKTSPCLGLRVSAHHLPSSGTKSCGRPCKVKRDVVSLTRVCKTSSSRVYLVYLMQT